MIDRRLGDRKVLCAGGEAPIRERAREASRVEVTNARGLGCSNLCQDMEGFK